VLKRTYFMTVIYGEFCLGMVSCTQTEATFRSSRLSEVRLWASSYNTSDTVVREIGDRSGSCIKH